jgi:ATPase family protein associated with various cellular activities (AAA)
MTEHNDELDFIEQAGTQVKKSDTDDEYDISPTRAFSKDDDGNVNPGSPTQYSHYGPGFKATTKTVEHLPAGIYDITADNNGIYCTPVAKPTGLLLELPEMRSDAVIALVERFWESEDDYKKGNDFVNGGAAFKAGIMIYGPPGSGKSCTIKIVSNKLVQRGGTVFFSSGHPNLAISFLSDFAKIEKDRKCIVILEDVDSLINNYGEAGYLEMLDSAKTIENVLFIATTNYPERLDPRIYNRPGRFSHVVKIGLPGPKAREAFLKAILKDHRDVSDIVKSTDGFTIDHLSALVNAVYREKKTLKTEIERLRTLFRVPKSDEKQIGLGFGAKGLVED